jgi:hypothetical protein
VVGFVLGFVRLGRTILRLDTDDHYLRAHALDVRGDAREHATAATADEDGVEWLAVHLLEHLQPNGALSRSRQ